MLHRTRGYGDGFRLLGINFDECLRMNAAVSELGREAGWRLKSILRPRRFFSKHQLINLYKSQVLSYLESGTAAYYHAADSVLQSIDRVQRRLVRELDLTEEFVLEKYRLAPLASRRDMAMLGFLHRVVLGDVPDQLRELFPRQPPPTHDPTTRLSVRRHSCQLVEPAFRTDVLKRSIFGLVVIYNLLPSKVVASKSIKLFQRMLQGALRRAAAANIPDWSFLFAPDKRLLRPIAFQDLFS